MVKAKNYDSPFDEEELENLEQSSIIDSEQIQNPDFFGDDNFYPSNSRINLPTTIWITANISPFSVALDDEESAAYKKYKEIEGLE